MAASDGKAQSESRRPNPSTGKLSFEGDSTHHKEDQLPSEKTVGEGDSTVDGLIKARHTQLEDQLLGDLSFLPPFPTTGSHRRINSGIMHRRAHSGAQGLTPPSAESRVSHRRNHSGVSARPERSLPATGRRPLHDPPAVCHRRNAVTLDFSETWISEACHRRNTVTLKTSYTLLRAVLL